MPILAYPCNKSSHRLRSVWAFLAATILLFGIFGCRDTSRLKLVAVQGTVTFQGKTVAGANVFFVPAKGPRASGETDRNGRFRLMTYSSGDGAVPGDFMVGITKFVKDEATSGDPVPKLKNELPEKYSNPSTSTLTATVEAGKKNDFSFDLKE